MKNKLINCDYKFQVKEFKTGIFDLFGYSVTCPADNQYSLLSVFAESQDDNILFYRSLVSISFSSFNLL